MVDPYRFDLKGPYLVERSFLQRPESQKRVPRVCQPGKIRPDLLVEEKLVGPVDDIANTAEIDRV